MYWHCLLWIQLYQNPFASASASDHVCMSLWVSTQDWGGLPICIHLAPTTGPRKTSLCVHGTISTKTSTICAKNRRNLYKKQRYLYRKESFDIKDAMSLNYVSHRAVTHSDSTEMGNRLGSKRGFWERNKVAVWHNIIKDIAVCLTLKYDAVCSRKTQKKPIFQNYFLTAERYQPIHAERYQPIQ